MIILWLILTKKVLISGTRQSNNCYHWVSNNNDSCNLTKEDQTQLWHKKLGHASVSVISKVIKNGAVLGISDIGPNNKCVCGDFQLGK